MTFTAEARAARAARDFSRRELVGTVASIPFHDVAGGNGNGTSGYIVCRLRSGEDCTGEAQDGEIEPGVAYRFLGRWVEHPRRGWQFRFEMVTQDSPVDKRGVVAYLVRETAMVTQALAEKLCDRYGAPSVIATLRDTPEVAVVDNFISSWKSGELARKLRELSAWERTKIDLFTLFAGRGFPRATVRACCEHRRLGVRAAELVRADPYRLLTHDISGVGFKRADKLYIELGHDPGRLKRQMLAAWDAIRSDSDGHTWHPSGIAKRAILGAVGLAAARFDDAIALGLRARWLATRTDADNRVWYTERQKAADEATVARELARLMRCRARLWPVVGDEGNPLIPSQRVALRSILGGPVGVLGGYAGTGKTFCAAWILGEVRRRIGRDRIAVCAPTGKAAVRITEAMSRYSLDLHEATTIHRLLEVGRNGHDGRGWGFQRCAAMPLDTSLVVVDELSMTDTSVMAALLSACPDGCHLLLLGDVAQLPPVGHGAPLRDIIAGGVPSAVLTEIQRNAGMIVEACAAIKDGKKFKTAAKFDDARPQDNLRWIEAEDPAVAMDILRSLINGVKASGRHDPTWDVQVLCALNEASGVARVPLNEMLQSILNPPRPDEPDTQFRRGDKIICLRNSFMGRWQLEMAPPDAVDSYVTARDDAGLLVDEVFVANGDVGQVVAVDERHAVVRFLWPSRTVRIELRRSRKDDVPENAAGGTAGDFSLAYSLTVHKSQGSEYPIVIIMCDDAGGAVASSEWWYTAASRASKLCICIGRRATLDKQCRQKKLPGRRTFLEPLIRELTTTPTPPSTTPGEDATR